jgi:predicted permease
MDEEIGFHLMMREREGKTASAARLRFGNRVLIQERIREAHTLHWLESFEQDIRYAFRTLQRSPVFASVAILSLALGIGANTAIFSLTNALLLKTLPVRHPEQLQLLRWSSGKRAVMNSVNGDFSGEGNARGSSSFSYTAYRVLNRDAKVFNDLFAFKDLGGISARSGSFTEQLRVLMVSGNFYRELGLEPFAGRAITEADDQPGAPPVAVLTYRYFESRFGRDLSVIGRVIHLNGIPFRVIGVNPPDFKGFVGTDSEELFLPVAATPELHPEPADPTTGIAKSALEDPTYWWIRVMGRLRPGVSKQQATAELNVLLERSVREQLPSKSNLDMPRIQLTPGNRNLNRGEFVLPILVLMGLVGIVLMIACANLASLSLARITGRQREIAARLALGAGRWRVVRQVLTESAVIALFGGVAGGLIGYWTRNVVPAMFETPWESERLDPSFDWTVLGFTAAISIITILLSGLIPALRATKVEIHSLLKTGGSGGGRPRAQFRAGKLFIVSQIALSILLLAAAGLFGRTLLNLKSVRLGFESSNLLLIGADPPLARYEGERRLAFYERVLERMRAIPGIESVTASSEALVAHNVSIGGFTPTGSLAREDGQDRAWTNTVDKNFFRTLKIPVLSGRDFNFHDTATSGNVAIVNRTLARKYFGDRDPIGQTFDKGNITIVGVCADAVYDQLRGPVPPTFYVPLSQSKGDVPHLTFELRASGEPRRFIPDARAAIAATDKDVPPFGIRTQDQQVSASVAQERVFATLTATFSLLALLLAAIGIYGLMAYTVARRTSEIGVRMAVGAHKRQVLMMILRETLWLAATGIAIGLGLAWAVIRAAEGLLYGLSPRDPATLAGVTLLMTIVAILAGLFPARRAASTDPMTALRYE